MARKTASADAPSLISSIDPLAHLVHLTDLITRKNLPADIAAQFAAGLDAGVSLMAECPIIRQSSYTTAHPCLLGFLFARPEQRSPDQKQRQFWADLIDSVIPRAGLAMVMDAARRWSMILDFPQGSLFPLLAEAAVTDRWFDAEGFSPLSTLARHKLIAPHMPEALSNILGELERLGCPPNSANQENSFCCLIDQAITHGSFDPRVANALLRAGLRPSDALGGLPSGLDKVDFLLQDPIHAKVLTPATKSALAWAKSLFEEIELRFSLEDATASIHSAQTPPPGAHDGVGGARSVRSSRRI